MTTGTRDEFLQAAERIGHRLCRDAFWAGARCNWLGWSMEYVRGQWLPAWRAQNGSLYSGTSGIAIFLARLFAFTREQLVRETAEGALAQALSTLDEWDGAARIGTYSGAAGVAYACIEAGELLENERLVKTGLEELARLRDVPPHPQHVDVLAGSAGAIPVLIDCAARFRREELFDTALRHGQHLLATAMRSDQGTSWDTLHVPGQRNLLGHAHGTAGIAHALFELFGASRKPELRDTALDALRYERSYFDAQASNWPDLRAAGAAAPAAFSVAWCHGAPGIGLSRLRVLQILDGDPAVAAEIEAALQTTVRALSQPVMAGQGNYSLCHGTGGNADFVLHASQALGRPDLRALVENVGRDALARFEATDEPWPCGVTGAGETPNLFLGLAGIGHFCLRLHDPVGVPSALLLTPRATERAAA